MQPKSSGSERTSSRLRDLVPFYAIPASKKTSAEIIKEARASVGLQSKMNTIPGGSGRLGMKPVSTKRPFTPREKQRTLFGSYRTARPLSSSLSLSLHAEEVEEEDAAATSPQMLVSPNNVGVRLPSLPPESAKVQRIQFRATPLGKLLEEKDDTLAPLGIVGTAVLRKKPTTPKEPTNLEAIVPPALKSGSVSPQQPLSVEAFIKPTHGKRSPGRVENKPEETKTQKSYVEADASLNVEPKSKQSKSDQKTTVISTSMKLNEKTNPIVVTNIPPPPSYDEVLSLTNVLQILAHQEGSAVEVETTLRKLYQACERANMLGRRQGSATGVRGQLLRALFLLVERSEQSVLLQLARLLLALQVMGPNLTAVCKLVFKVSRCDQNDQLFLEDNILELLLERLGGASLVEDAEASVYGYGALKFVTMDPHVVTRVLQLGGLELMVLHMKLINLMAQESGGRVPEQAMQALFQLTGALRHVAGDTAALPNFVTSGALAQICRTLQLFATDPDLMSNIVRTLSITSTHDACCDALVAQPGCLRACVALLERFPRRQDLVVRLSYALGNVMARSEHARRQLLGEEGSRASVLAVLGRCLADDQAATILEPEGPGSPPLHATEDVLVKVLRVVANASLSEEVGPGLADSPEVLGTILDVLGAKNAVHSEELVLGALLTLNNVSFYPNAEKSRLADQQIYFAEALVPLLSSPHPSEATVEALRVFGNLTRWKQTRDYLAEQQVGVRVLEFLADRDPELQYVAAGVLVNLMADPETRTNLRKQGSVHRLTGILQDQGARGDGADWELAGLACQALWNSCADVSDMHIALGTAETDCLVTLLADLLDDERLFGVAEESTVPEDVASSPAYLMWEEFASVATNLLERLEAFLESQQEDMEQQPQEP